MHAHAAERGALSLWRWRVVGTCSQSCHLAPPLGCTELSAGAGKEGLLADPQGDDAQNGPTCQAPLQPRVEELLSPDVVRA